MGELLTLQCLFHSREYVYSQAMVFSGIADPVAGSIAIEYQQVPCNPPGNMIADIIDNRGAGAWVRFTVEVRHTIVADLSPARRGLNGKGW